MFRFIVILFIISPEIGFCFQLAAVSPGERVQLYSIGRGQGFLGQMLKGPGLKSSGLHTSIFQDRPNRGALHILKISKYKMI